MERKAGFFRGSCSLHLERPIFQPQYTAFVPSCSMLSLHICFHFLTRSSVTTRFFLFLSKQKGVLAVLVWCIQGYIKRHSDVLSQIFLLCVSCFQMHLPMPVVQVIPWLWCSVCVGSDSVEENILLIPNQSKLYTSTSSVTHQKVDRHTWIYFFSVFC